MTTNPQHDGKERRQRCTFLGCASPEERCPSEEDTNAFPCLFSDLIFPECTTWSHPPEVAELKPRALQAIGRRSAPAHLTRSHSGSLVFKFNPWSLRGAPFRSRSNPPPSEPALRAWHGRGIEGAAGRQGLRTGMVCHGSHRPRARLRHPPWEPPEPAKGRWGCQTGRCAWQRPRCSWGCVVRTLEG